MFVKMTVRVANNPNNPRKWTITETGHILNQFRDLTQDNVDMITQFVDKFVALASAMMKSDGYSAYRVVEDSDVVYSCTFFEDEASYTNSMTENEEHLSEVLTLRSQILDLFDMHVVEPVTFNVETVESITVDYLRTKYEEFLN